MHRRPLLLVAAALVAGLFAWCGGLLLFVRAASEAEPQPPHADGIVALTGGAARVGTALRLLAEGRADQLLVSGIGGGAELRELAVAAGIDPIPLAAQVTLGRAATTTRGNAAETEVWAREHGIHSLIVVTAFYHMPRALTELHRAMPDVHLFPVPVLNVDQPGPGGMGHLVPMRLLAQEYSKYLVSLTGLSDLLPGRELAPPHGPSS